MSKFKTAMNLLLHNRNTFIALLVQSFSFLFNDKNYLDLVFKYRMGYKIDWDNPKTFSEKLNWLKIHDHNPLYKVLVDKHDVKTYVEEILGKGFVIPTIGIWAKPEDINFETLPERFVLKTTHGGGNEGVIICKDRAIFEPENALSKLRKSMKQDIYRESREWPYKNLSKRIICEPYIEDSKTKELRDYKFFCFDGEVRTLFVATGRQNRKEPFFNFFDQDYNPLPIKQGHPVSEKIPEKPITFEKMKEAASLLSKGFPHVRVDLYEVDNKVLFGELTFYHFGAVVPFEPQTWDYEFGKMLNLPNIK